MRAIVVICVVCVGACSGPSFTPSDCEDADCAGASSGGLATGGASQGGTNGAGDGGEPSGGSDSGGSDSGGSNNGGSDSGGSSSGGSDSGGSSSGGSDSGGSGGSGMSGSDGSGTGGSSGSGTSGAAGTGVAGFPSTRVLDDFDRDAVELGDNWIGSTELYEIRSRTLHCPAGYCSGAFWYEAFGAAQEVFATVVSFSEYSPEVNLVLKAQGSVDCDLIEVFYSPANEDIMIDGCWDGVWISFGHVAVHLEPGDQIGGRVGSDGFIEIFRNGELLHTVDARNYPFIDSDGYIGVNGIVGNGEAANVYDDFGGGSL